MLKITQYDCLVNAPFLKKFIILKKNRLDMPSFQKGLAIRTWNEVELDEKVATYL